MYNKVGEKRRIADITDDEEAILTLSRLGSRPPMSPKGVVISPENEKKLRREIANSNERRRMQSINAGFAALKDLLPHPENEKLSKAAILQHTADYVFQLEQEKVGLRDEINVLLKKLGKTPVQISRSKANNSQDVSPRDELGIHSVSPDVPMDTLISQTTLSPKNSTAEIMSNGIMDCRMHYERDLKKSIKLEEYTHSLEDGFKKSQLSIVRPTKMMRMSTHHRDIDVKDEQLTPAQTPEHTVEFKVDPLGLEGKGKCVRKSPIYATSPTTVVYEQPQGAMSRPTIVTVLSAKEVPRSPPKPMPSLLEVNAVAEDASPVASTDSAVEYLDEDHMVYIVNSNNNCQKSLDTICEAIRHLEGDHMFPVEDQHSRLEEEVVTEETYTVEEDLHQSVPQDLHHYHQSSDAPTVVPRYHTQHRLTHPLGGSMSHLSLQMMRPEPQEAPLELTTTHRVSKASSPVFSSPVLNSTICRPGVIVVKQA